MKKILLIIAACILLTPLFSYSYEIDVEITIKDLDGNNIPNLNFLLINKAKSSTENVTTDSEGLLKTKLHKGDNIVLSFESIEEKPAYNISIPADIKYKQYRLVCRLPVVIADNVKDNKKFSSTGKKIDITITLQNKDRRTLNNHKFLLFNSDSVKIGEGQTDGTGKFRTKLVDGNLYFVVTMVYGIEYYDHFIIDPEAKIYNYRLILPFPSQGHQPPGDGDFVDNISFGKQRKDNFEPDELKNSGYRRTYILENVNFESGKWNLKPESFHALNELLGELTSKPNMVIEIAGHTDNVGKEKDNQILSERRAETIVKWLISKGIDGNRLTPRGYGELYPIATNETAAGRAKNRRSEVRVISE